MELGCRFDGWREHFDFAKWQQAFNDCGIDPAWYLRQRHEDEILPWDHIDCGLPKSFFLEERKKAFTGTATLDCRDGVCHGCGVCDFDSLRMRLIDPRMQETQTQETQTPDQRETAEQLTRVRLRMSKLGRARMVGHLEYLKMFQRAASRARLPLRYSQGFHPMPKISYLEALPMGVSSEAELIDLELLYPVAIAEIMNGLNAQLPEGFEITEGEVVPWKTPSPSASVASSRYLVTLSEQVPADLPARITRDLKAGQIIVTRSKKGREEQLDIRPDLIDLSLIDNQLSIELVKGSPLLVAARLLDLGVEDIRRLGVHKAAITLKQL